MSEGTRRSRPAEQPAVAWSWPRALVGGVYGLPAALVSLADPQLGVPLAVGVLPAVMLPIPGARRSRITILVIGTLAGLSMFVGGTLAQLPAVLTALLLIAAVTGAAVLSSVTPRGLLVLTLCVPLMAAGLSFDDWAK